MKLLAHITYFDNNSTRGVSSRTSALKTSVFWRDFNFNAVVRLLDEMDRAYTDFERIDAVVDVNEDNAYRTRLQDWRGWSSTSVRRVEVTVATHKLPHPFMLAWKLHL